MKSHGMGYNKLDRYRAVYVISDYLFSHSIIIISREDFSINMEYIMLPYLYL